MTKSRHVAPPRCYWREDELAVMRANYPHVPTQQIADQLGRSPKQIYSQAKNLGLRKSDAYLASPDACRLRMGDAPGWAHRFKPGHETWNRGTKGVSGLHPNTRAHWLRPGNKPQTTVPIGSRRITSDGYLEIKVADTPGVYTLRWRGVHRLVWEREHGPAPAGMVVTFKAGLRTAVEADITLDALECVTRAELMRRNSVHTRYPELAPVVRAAGVLTRQINRRQKGSAP